MAGENVLSCTCHFDNLDCVFTHLDALTTGWRLHFPHNQVKIRYINVFNIVNIHVSFVYLSIGFKCSFRN